MNLKEPYMDPMEPQKWSTGLTIVDVGLIRNIKLF